MQLVERGALLAAAALDSGLLHGPILAESVLHVHQVRRVLPSGLLLPADVLHHLLLLDRVPPYDLLQQAVLLLRLLVPLGGFITRDPQLFLNVLVVVPEVEPVDLGLLLHVLQVL